MSATAFSWDLFQRVPIVGIIRGMKPGQLRQILPIYQEAGLTNVEITMNTEDAEEMIQYALENFAGTLNIGAGTVCNKKDLKKALNAGAQFIVTPFTRKKIIKKCVEKDIPVFPGALSPGEIYTAYEAGAQIVKVFPAATLGPSYIKDLKGPLNSIKLMPTGGVDLENIEQFKQAGADGYGIGSPLFKKELIESEDWNSLKDHFKKFVLKIGALA